MGEEVTARGKPHICTQSTKATPPLTPHHHHHHYHHVKEKRKRKRQQSFFLLNGHNLFSGKSSLVSKRVEDRGVVLQESLWLVKLDDLAMV